MFRTTHATSAGGQACLGGGRDDVASMCAACVDEHKPLLIPKRSVAHEAGEGWLKRDSCRASSTSGCGGSARWRRQGRDRRSRAGGEQMTVIAVWSHGLVRYGRNVPVDSSDQIATFLKCLINVQKSWVARLANLAGAKPISVALTAAGSGSPLAPLAPTSRDVADQVFTMWGGLRSGWSAQTRTATKCESKRRQRRGADNVDASDKRSPRGRGIPSFVMDVGLPANRSKADVREIIVPVPTCVIFEDTMVNRGAVGPVPMERQM